MEGEGDQARDPSGLVLERAEAQQVRVAHANGPGRNRIASFVRARQFEHCHRPANWCEWEALLPECQQLTGCWRGHHARW